MKLFRSVLVSAMFLLVSQTCGFAQTRLPELVSEVRRAIVTVTTYDRSSNPVQQGTGFFIAPDRIVTNFRLVDTSRNIQLTTFNGETTGVTSVLAFDPKKDLAVLQINGPCRDTASLKVKGLAASLSEQLADVNKRNDAQWKVTVGEAPGAWTFEHLTTHLNVTASLVPDRSGTPGVMLRGFALGNAGRGVSR